MVFAGFICLPFLLLNNLQLALENPFAGEEEQDADPDDIRLDELQLMTYMTQDADSQMHAELQRRMTVVCILCWPCWLPWLGCTHSFCWSAAHPSLVPTAWEHFTHPAGTGAALPLLSGCQPVGGFRGDVSR